MDVEKIVFHSNWNYGDVFSNKEWVRQIANIANDHNIEVLYVTNRNAKCMNLPIKWEWIGELQHIHLQSNPAPYFDIASKTIFISTWVGHGPMQDGHNYASQIPMWTMIHGLIKRAAGIDIEMFSIDEYASSIDLDLIDIPNLDNIQTQVMFCNNLATSGQSFVDNHEQIICRLALEYPDITMICTNKFNTDIHNILFTDNINNNINNQLGRDLGECGYISEQCDIIITNSSGPGTFCWTKKNIQNNQKTFIVFTINQNNCFTYNLLNPKCRVEWSSTTDKEEIYQMIKREIERKYR